MLAFVHGDPESIPVGKTEKEPALQVKLERFRTDVMTEHPIRRWTTAAELGGLVSRSLIREIKISPRPGWIRNDGSSPIALLEKINVLSEENSDLKEQLAAQETTEDSDDDLESGEDHVEVYGNRTERDEGYERHIVRWSVNVTWNDLFRKIGPSLINETTEEQLKQILTRYHWQDKPSHEVITAVLLTESWNEILVQFRALGLIEQGIKKRAVSDKGSYWRITPKGDRLLVRLLARRKSLGRTQLDDI